MEQSIHAQPTSFSEKLKYQRELRGWSQSRMAEELGTTPNRISSWERGVSIPSAYFRAKICTLFAMDAVELGLLFPENQSSSHVDNQPSLLEPTFEKKEEPISLLPTIWHKRIAHIRPLRSYPLWLYVSMCLLILLLCSSLIWLRSSSTTNPYPPHAGQLVLNDALVDQEQDANWQEGMNENQAGCSFHNAAYVVTQPRAGLFHACFAQQTDYQNFAYEVEMTIHSGDFGGLVFRAQDSEDSHYYLLRIHTNGTYLLYRFVDNSIEHAVLLASGILPSSFHKGINTTNLVGVVAQDSLLTIYINQEEISAVRDNTYSHGQIGVLTGSMATGAAQAAFQQARVWTW